MTGFLQKILLNFLQKVKFLQMLLLGFLKQMLVLGIPIGIPFEKLSRCFCWGFLLGDPSEIYRGIHYGISSGDPFGILSRVPFGVL